MSTSDSSVTDLNDQELQMLKLVKAVYQTKLIQSRFADPLEIDYKKEMGLKPDTAEYEQVSNVVQLMETGRYESFRISSTDIIVKYNANPPQISPVKQVPNQKDKTIHLLEQIFQSKR